MPVTLRVVARRKAPFAWAMSLLVPATACNAIIGNEAELTYDGLPGVPIDGSSDGSPDPTDAEAALDADATADVAADGALDGGGDGARPPCDGAVFCSDFDPPWDVAPFYGWSDGTATDAQLVSDATTAPFALEITTNDPGVPRVLHVGSLAVDEPASYAFDVRIVGAPSTGGEEATIARARCSGGAYLRMRIAGPNLTLSKGVTPAETASLPFARNVWTRVAIVTDALGVLLLVGANNARISDQCSRITDIEMGLYFAAGGTWTARFDHVLLAAP